jgi:hypothetical protein
VFFLILFFSGKKSETIEPENKKKSEACGMLNQTSAAAVQTQRPKDGAAASRWNSERTA